MNTVPEYELQLTVKNAKLLNLMRELGYKSVAQLSREACINNKSIYDILNLKEAAYSNDGLTLRPVVERLCKFLGVGPEEIFPEDQLINPLLQNKFVAQLTKENMVALSNDVATDPALLLDHIRDRDGDRFEDMMSAVGNGLTQREKEVLRLRYKEGMSYEEIGKKFDIGKQRVWQLEMRSLRRLRHPKLSDPLIDSSGGFGEGIRATKEDT